MCPAEEQQAFSAPLYGSKFVCYWALREVLCVPARQMKEYEMLQTKHADEVPSLNPLKENPRCMLKSSAQIVLQKVPTTHI